MNNTEADVRMLSEVDSALDAVPERSEKILTEHLSDFSADNMSFEDITAVIMDHTEDLFSLTVAQDRFSSEYLDSCRTLLKAIRHLGSSYLTKTALIARDFGVPKLEPLSARRLQEMVSFHIRKCDAAMKEIRANGGDFSFEHYDLLLELANSSQRLRATQNKAFDVKCWITEPHRLAETAMTFTKTNGHYINDTNDYRPQPFRSKSAYGLRKEVLDEYEQTRGESYAMEVREPDVPMLPAAETAEKRDPADTEDRSELFALIDKRDPGMGAALSAADRKATEKGFSKAEKGLLFNAVQYETVREMIHEHLRDPERCARDPERAAAYRRVTEILDG